jgi:hypothetical protein
MTSRGFLCWRIRVFASLWSARTAIGSAEYEAWRELISEFITLYKLVKQVHAEVPDRTPGDEWCGMLLYMCGERRWKSPGRN